MHKTVTHNRCYATYNGFCDAVLGFLRRDVPSRWSTLCDSVTDNFRIISPENFRVLSSTLLNFGGTAFPRESAQAGKDAGSSRGWASGAGIFTMSRLWPEV